MFEDRLDLFIYQFVKPTLPNLTLRWRKFPPWVHDVIPQLYSILDGYDDTTILTDDQIKVIKDILTFMKNDAESSSESLFHLLSAYFIDTFLEEYIVNTKNADILAMMHRPFDDVIQDDLNLTLNGHNLSLGETRPNLDYILNLWMTLDDIMLEMSWVEEMDKFKYCIVYVGEVHVRNMTSWFLKQGFRVGFEKSSVNSDAQCVDISKLDQPVFK